ncbi:serine hydrolase domain-containing protein [Bacillus sp. FJAT-27986]|uniref:serine hydrolase domain-containing protein n=1 Tax=Bacillus sp. FJAT-27986 TaxID=1743146 RepID=UPI00080ACEB9|nr:serine hydrolase domain-containing protein [Bacillus sp. FJAT-27986]OCA86832.1 serine hydrolase [Bacillus sp. FJAT-27986]
MKKITSIAFSTMITVSAFNTSDGLMMTSAKGHSDNASYWDEPGRMLPILLPSNARMAGMKQSALDDIDVTIGQYIESGLIPGAVTFVARSGHIVQKAAYGFAALYQDDGFTEIETPLKMKADTIFDIASISKLFTTTAVMMLYEQGIFQLDDPVALHLSQFAANGKEDITIRQLLTHTSGFAAGMPLYMQEGTRESRIQSVLQHGLINEPGTTYLYSDLNMITLGALVEKWSGLRQDEFVKKAITEPLGMKDTMYNPPAKLKKRIAATEYQPKIGRGLVWGEVHDENAWSLEGVAGHAGVFSTAKDLGILAHAYLNDGKYGKIRILKKKTIDLIMKNYNTAFPGNDHGLGFELNQGWYMDSLSDTFTAGHTGYTGTALVMSPSNQTVAIVLTNRVHPSRNTPSINPIRRTFARDVGDSIPINVKKGQMAWFAGYGDQLDNILSAQVNLKRDAYLSFDTWFRIEEESDYGYLETSTDGKAFTSIQSFTGKSNGWEKENVLIPAGTKFIRFSYKTDESVNGRGWYVQDASIKTNGKKERLRFESNGFERRTD